MKSWLKRKTSCWWVFWWHQRFYSVLRSGQGKLRQQTHWSHSENAPKLISLANKRLQLDRQLLQSQTFIFRARSQTLPENENRHLSNQSDFRLSDLPLRLLFNFPLSCPVPLTFFLWERFKESWSLGKMCSQYCQLAKWSHRFFSPFGELTSRGGALAGRALTDSKFWHPNRNSLSNFNDFNFMMHFQLFTLRHVTGFSDLVDLWVIKIKSPWSFAHVIRRDHVNRTTRRVYSVVKRRLYDYQTWQTSFLEIHEVRKGMWAFLPFDCADWLGRQTPITWRNTKRLSAFVSRTHVIFNSSFERERNAQLKINSKIKKQNMKRSGVQLGLRVVLALKTTKLCTSTVKSSWKYTSE